MNLKSIRTQQLLLAVVVLVASAGSWLALPAQARANESSDYHAFYEPVARAFLEGKGLSVPQGGLASTYPPGFPLFVAGAIGIAQPLGIPANTILWLVQLGCILVSVLLIHALARAVFGAEVGLLAALLWATYPPLWWLAKQPSSEMPFLPLLYLAIFESVRMVQQPRAHWHALVAGVAAGFAALIRPIALLPLLALALAGPLALPGRRLRVGLAALTLLGAILTVAPWVIALRQQTGAWVPLSTNGAASIRDGLTFGLPKGYRSGFDLPPDIRALMLDLRARHDAGQLSTSTELADAMAQVSRERPLTVARLYAWKAARAWYATDSNRGEGWLLLLQLPYLALATLGAYSCWRAGGRQRHFLWLALALVGAFWLMTILALSIARYTVPIMGLVHILAALGLNQMAGAVMRRRLFATHAGAS